MDTENPEKFMRLAIEVARKSKTPFGAVIVKDNQVVERAGNTVQPDNDPTCHAEVNAIRRLTQRVGSAAPSGLYTLYSTCEPCTMCAATCFWAGISDIVYGVGANDFSDSNPNMIGIRCEEVFKRSPSDDYSIQSGLLLDECKQLHQDFPLE
ncbi:nucleoside deaminase [Nodosilinea sp. LEGE 07088]|uniref:nucleoside deaminase n=1 Tax=Nodosilinea sp. LEGE 07088 TaxID=2777968 RepID=UPI00187F419B|nr:nucleoside deaminase [Nodosilinea sp. LEGE 07088]MBE9139719.1 nucleoside deaminase [Nodosilinea sp. LEGE 07088]